MARRPAPISVRAKAANFIGDAAVADPAPVDGMRIA
jgi:hypothetical protein